MAYREMDNFIPRLFDKLPACINSKEAQMGSVHDSIVLIIKSSK